MELASEASGVVNQESAPTTGDEKAPVGNSSGTVSQTTLYSLKAGAMMGGDNGKTKGDFRFIGLYQHVIEFYIVFHTNTAWVLYRGIREKC